MDDATVLDNLRKEIQRQVKAGCESLDIDAFLKHAVWSRRQTERLFRERFLTSPARYFRDYQATLAKQCLIDGENVLSTAHAIGFASTGRLHEAMISRYGLTPGEVRSGGEGVKMYFGFFVTQIGIVMMAATERGLSQVTLCGAEMGDDDALERVAELQKSYKQAELIESTQKLQTYADQLVDFLEKRSPSFCPPLDILQGTTFQREVWAELRKLSAGETATYSEIAERIGKPKAVRAVAQACARNNVAIAIPCHRVIRQDGALSGYRWGVEWKQQLLKLEAEIQQAQLM